MLWKKVMGRRKIKHLAESKKERGTGRQGWPEAGIEQDSGYVLLRWTRCCGCRKRACSVENLHCVPQGHKWGNGRSRELNGLNWGSASTGACWPPKAGFPTAWLRLFDSSLPTPRTGIRENFQPAIEFCTKSWVPLTRWMHSRGGDKVLWSICSPQHSKATRSAEQPLATHNFSPVATVPRGFSPGQGRGR